MRLSGLQKEVLALYRNCLRESRKKPAHLQDQNSISISKSTRGILEPSNSYCAKDGVSWKSTQPLESRTLGKTMSGVPRQVVSPWSFLERGVLPLAPGKYYTFLIQGRLRVGGCIRDRQSLSTIILGVE
ncbi:hypothetical protein F5X96DRAFT_330360 [Biscogniauxia mediterranea]|nr:hypothetical protein F5X96DRAFT_330360 [Biscogniauxia mediterranea]